MVTVSQGLRWSKIQLSILVFHYKCVLSFVLHVYVLSAICYNDYGTISVTVPFTTAPLICFSCDKTSSPSSCSNLALCEPNQVSLESYKVL